MADAAKGKSGSYTWQELRKHNTLEAGLWVAMDGIVYDVTNFVDRHPGGAQLLKISAGRDCTDLFKSYHNLTEKPQQLLSKYQIGKLTNYELNTFKQDTGFYKECTDRVQEYFTTNNLHPKSPVPGLIRLALFIFLMVTTYYTIWLTQASLIVKFFSSVIFGICQALCLLHQMHDASHSAIGATPLWWNLIGRLTMEWIAGASLLSWFHQHVLGHHIYTNVMGADPDLPFLKEGDLRFLVNRQVWKSSYKYQHLYMPPLYGLLAVKFRLQDFTWTFLSESNGSIFVNPISKGEWVHHILTKLFWFNYRVILPLFLFSVSWKAVLFHFIITELATGYWLAINFQVSHISTSAHFPASEKVEQNLKDEWAVSQVITSVDYGHGSFLQTFLSGALNYQTVHHLFPGVSQYHYPALAPIIMDVCKKYKVPYNVLPSFSDAFKAHWEYLYNKGNKV